MLKTVVTFQYENWACTIANEQMTRSVAKMKKIIKNDIADVLMHGFKKYGGREAPFKMVIPFRFDHYVEMDQKVKIDFAKNCVFACKPLPETIKTNAEDAEVSVGGKITVTIEWKQ